MKTAKVPILTLVLFWSAQIALYAGPKYAMGLFHFNLQYVAGDHKIETRIIRESLLPALQFFEQYPQYKADIEIQGWAIEELAEEHPETWRTRGGSSAMGLCRRATSILSPA